MTKISNPLLLLLLVITFLSPITCEDIPSHDFIIVGGGLSGCVVGGRLSEKHSVLILEAGGDPGNELDIPATMLSLLGNKNYIKVYQSIPQANAGLGRNGVLNFVIGSTLGGGSSVNGMVYNRGSPYDYDHWANVTGDPSWNYNNLLRFFKKIEDYHGIFPNEMERGAGGPISIETSRYAPGLDMWLEGGKSLGYPTSGPNGPQQMSFTPLEFTRRHGKRVSAFTGYLKPFLETRPNLKVIQHATVKKILFEKNGALTRAIGVIYMEDGETKTVKAKKEVIISAGTMDSTALLMKSGIGPEDVLKAANIDPVKILPVGYNLQDHAILRFDFAVDKGTEIFNVEQDLTREAWKIFEETGDGPYSSCNGAHGQAFLVSSKRKLEQPPNSLWPDIKLFHFQSPTKIGVYPELEPTGYYENDDLLISTVVALARPQSHGRVTLNTTNMDGQPLIDFRFFTHPDDMEILLEAVKITLRLYEGTPAFQRQGARYSKEPYDPCMDHPFRSDDYWRCYIRHMAGSGLHAGGTCRMGSGQDDLKAVVDSRLKVIGVDGLRVVDLSIVPHVTNANTQAVAYVIAEKASDMILRTWEDEHEFDQYGSNESKNYLKIEL